MASVVLWTSTACVRRAEKRGAIGTVSMTTLYDVLGARAGDIAPVDPLDLAAPSKVAKAEPEPDLHSRDPQFYRERAVISYRNGDLDGALTDLDQAIRLDPSSASAYIDRSIVLYRKAEIERALKDMATAMRIERSRHASLPPAKPPKASAVLSKN